MSFNLIIITSKVKNVYNIALILLAYEFTDHNLSKLNKLAHNFIIARATKRDADLDFQTIWKMRG